MSKKYQGLVANFFVAGALCFNGCSNRVEYHEGTVFGGNLS
jgi:hypothetical protein